MTAHHPKTDIFASPSTWQTPPTLAFASRAASLRAMTRLLTLLLALFALTLPAHAADDISAASRSVVRVVTVAMMDGEVVGFVSTPMPKTWKTRLLAAHFKMLMWVFAPAARIRNREQAEPRLYWLTREALSRNLDKLKVG